VGAEPSSQTALIRGTHVRVVSGPFEGRLGVLQELDGKGGATVLFGLLPARLPLAQLVAATRRDRPVFASSHKRAPGRLR
jgi:hypothetical protein